jgi:hypothetical protein
MQDAPIPEKMNFLTDHHMGFDPDFQDLIDAQDQKYNKNSFFPC